MYGYQRNKISEGWPERAARRVVLIVTPSCPRTNGKTYPKVAAQYRSTPEEELCLKNELNDDPLLALRIRCA
jgi:hypothetical protein